jgi:hypothetical protein
LLAKRPLTGPKSFLKKRTHDLFREGLEAGLRPAHDNPIDNRIIKDLGLLAFRAFGWQLGTALELGGGAVDLAAMAKAMAQRKRPVLKHRTALAERAHGHDTNGGARIGFAPVLLEFSKAAIEYFPPLGWIGRLCHIRVE